jgi:hypothetical protein
MTNTVVRAAYTRSLSGASIDQSSQLEPVQVAGFLQSFRSIAPESVGGSEAGAKFETYGVALEQKFVTRTYLGLSAGSLRSQADRSVGVFDLDFSDYAHPNQTGERLDYRENTLLVTLNQLVGHEWSFGATYRLSDAVLQDRFPDVLPVVDSQDPLMLKGFRRNQRLEATLHHLSLDALYNHHSGFFGHGQAIWYSQSNSGYETDRPGDNFWQFNVFAGYRFPRRRVELSAGILNLANQDYHLNPLSPYDELPRRRTLVLRMQFNL